MPLHVTTHAKGLPTALMWALERLLARVAMAVNTEAAGARKGFVAGLADVTILGLREAGLRRGRNVMVVLPRVGAARGLEAYRDGDYWWWEVLQFVG